MRKLILLVVVLLCTGVADAQQYWKIDEGGNSIIWQVKKGDAHHDHIEMAWRLSYLSLRANAR